MRNPFKKNKSCSNKLVNTQLLQPVFRTERRFFCRRIKMKVIKRDTERDYFMSAHEAIEYGIIDEVLQLAEK